MSLKTLTKLMLVGAVLLVGTAATASETKADWMTTLSVKLELLNKLGTDSLHIDVDSMNGAVNLKGTVDKRETKELATTVAKSVSGVQSVDNDLTLEAAMAKSKPAAAVDEGQAEVKDAIVETKLRIALVDKMGTDGFKIGTEVASGVATLEFDKACPSNMRNQAVAIAQGVEGVSKVLSVDKKG